MLTSNQLRPGRSGHPGASGMVGLA